VLGELDALVVAGHPEGDAETGAAHACGHNAQIAGMLGAAIGLLDAKAFDQLAGRVAFFSVPAEEYGDIEWRIAQARAGKLEFLGGKARAAAARTLRRRGPGDDDPHDVAGRGRKAGVPVSNNGCIVKTCATSVGRRTRAGPAHGGERASTPPRSASWRSMRSARPSATRTRSASTRSSPTAARR